MNEPFIWNIESLDIYIKLNESSEWGRCTISLLKRVWLCVNIDTYECATWHIWMSRITLMKWSCHASEWVVSHMWMSHVTRMKYVCLLSINARVVVCEHRHVQTCISLPHMNKSCHAYEIVMSHMWMSHVTCMKEACLWQEASNRWYLIRHILYDKRHFIWNATSYMIRDILYVCQPMLCYTHVWGHDSSSHVRSSNQAPWHDSSSHAIIRVCVFGVRDSYHYCPIYIYI